MCAVFNARQHPGNRAYVSTNDGSRGLDNPVGVHLNFALGLSNEMGPPPSTPLAIDSGYPATETASPSAKPAKKRPHRMVQTMGIFALGHGEPVSPHRSSISSRTILRTCASVRVLFIAQSPPVVVPSSTTLHSRGRISSRHTRCRSVQRTECNSAADGPASPKPRSSPLQSLPSNKEYPRLGVPNQAIVRGAVKKIARRTGRTRASSGMGCCHLARSVCYEHIICPVG